MQIIKAQFLKNEIPSGRAYTYFSNEVLKIGDVVEVPSPKGAEENPKAVVCEVDVPEFEIESFKDKVKTVIAVTGKLEVEI